LSAVEDKFKPEEEELNILVRIREYGIRTINKREGILFYQ
jgi:hypothetical protein